MSGNDTIPHNTPPRAAILGCSGLVLTEEEKIFFAKHDPFGFILFARNVGTPDQVRALTASLRETVGRDAPILVDQEGGRVRRLRPPHWRDVPAMRHFGDWFRSHPDQAEAALRLTVTLMADDLRAVGISVNCAPVMDVPVHGAHTVIGDRAFGDDPHVVGRLGKVACEAFLERGIYPVIKHIPGHGRSTVDSHVDLPVVKDDLDRLLATDFLPFFDVKDAPFAMTAHIVYTALDPERPATLSPDLVQEVIRRRIGFEGMLLSDDVSMKALRGDVSSLAWRSLSAGCDVVLHCNGNIEEMAAVMTATGPLSDLAMARWQRAQAMLRVSKPHMVG